MVYYIKIDPVTKKRTQIVYVTADLARFLNEKTGVKTYTSYINSWIQIDMSNRLDDFSSLAPYILITNLMYASAILTKPVDVSKKVTLGTTSYITKYLLDGKGTAQIETKLQGQGSNSKLSLFSNDPKTKSIIIENSSTYSDSNTDENNFVLPANIRDLDATTIQNQATVAEKKTIFTKTNAGVDFKLDSNYFSACTLDDYQDDSINCFKSKNLSYVYFQTYAWNGDYTKTEIEKIKTSADARNTFISWNTGTRNITDGYIKVINNNAYIFKIEKDSKFQFVTAYVVKNGILYKFDMSSKISSNYNLPRLQAEMELYLLKSIEFKANTPVVSKPVVSNTVPTASYDKNRRTVEMPISTPEGDYSYKLFSDLSFSNFKGTSMYGDFLMPTFVTPGDKITVSSFPMQRITDYTWQKDFAANTKDEYVALHPDAKNEKGFEVRFIKKNGYKFIVTRSELMSQASSWSKSEKWVDYYVNVVKENYNLSDKFAKISVHGVGVDPKDTADLIVDSFNFTTPKTPTISMGRETIDQLQSFPKYGNYSYKVFKDLSFKSSGVGKDKFDQAVTYVYSSGDDKTVISAFSIQTLTDAISLKIYNIKSLDEYHQSFKDPSDSKTVVFKSYSKNGYKFVIVGRQLTYSGGQTNWEYNINIAKDKFSMNSKYVTIYVTGPSNPIDIINLIADSFTSSSL